MRPQAACSEPNIAVWSLTSLITNAGVKIVLLHELKNDEGIRLFLQDTWEAYVKVGQKTTFPLQTS